jgi:hypothetical protein
MKVILIAVPTSKSLQNKDVTVALNCAGVAMGAIEIITISEETTSVYIVDAVLETVRKAETLNG